MQAQLKKVNEKITVVEHEFHQAKTMLFEAEEAVTVLKNKLNVFKGKQQSLLEVKQILEEAIEENKPKK